MARDEINPNQDAEQSVVRQFRDDLVNHEETMRELVSAIRHQIKDSDDRHSDVLGNMRQRLGALTSDVQDIRQRIPENLSGDLQRIEQGLDTLTDRVATIAVAYPGQGAPQSHSNLPEYEVAEAPVEQRDASSEMSDDLPAPEQDVPVQPAALRSGAPASTATMEKAEGAVDPFDMIESSLPGDPSSPWDRDTAEVLATMYDDDETISQFKRETSAADEMPARTPDPEVTSPAHDFVTEAEVQEVAPHAVAVDREWLDLKFAEIASWIEQTLADFNPEQTYHQFSERFDDFEQRLGSALDEVATHSDLTPLRELESQLEALNQQLTATESNMHRLDSIEGHLALVSSQIGEGASAFVGDVPAGIDADQVAEAAASRIADYLASSGLGSGDTGQGSSIDEMRNMIENLLQENRDGNEQTSMMLDTMQQAMMRVLDRLDALEVSHYKGQPAGAAAPGEVAGFSGGDVEAGAEPTYQETEAAAHGWQESPERLDSEEGSPVPDGEGFISEGYGAEDGVEADVEIHGAEAATFEAEAAMQDDAADFSDNSEPAQPAYPTHDLITHRDDAVKVPAEPKASSRDAIDRIRHNFIADAQRAKEQAAAEAAQVAVEGPKGRTRRSVLAGTTPEKSSSGGMFSAKTRRLLVGALVAVIVINGALYLMPRGDKGAGPKDPASVTKPNKPSAKSEKSGKNKQSHVFSSDPLLQPAVSDAVVETQLREALVEARHRADGGLELPFGLAIQQSTGGNWTAPDQEMASHPAITAVAVAPEAEVPPAPVAGMSDTASTTKKLDMPPASVGPHSLRLAAANGDASAQFEVATRLSEGKGMDQDIGQAAKWFKRSAAQGFAQAQYRLGTLYERGLGVRQDAGRAKVWYLRAAEQGNVKAMHNLAVMSAGQASGSPDYATASQWFLKAAERGLADSQFNVGVLYENGLGVGQDSKEAYKWYSLAARTGDKEAMRRSQKLRSSLPIDELGEAEQAVRAFVPTAIDPLINNARLAGQDWKKRANG